MAIANRILQGVALFMVIAGVTVSVLNLSRNLPVAFTCLAWAVWFGYMGLRSFSRKASK